MADAWVRDVAARAKRKEVAEFLSQPACSAVVRDWVIGDAELTMTDMCDFYKLSMVGVFSRVQKKLPGLRMCFYLAVRQRSEAKLEQLFQPGSDSAWNEFRVRQRDEWLRRIFALPTRRFDRDALVAASGVCSAKMARLGDTGWMLSPPEEVSVRVFLRDRREPREAYWGEVHAGPSGYCLRFGQGPHAGGSVGLDSFAGALPGGAENLEVVALAEGPWTKVTWFETTMMQTTASTLASMMMHSRGWREEDYYAGALDDIVSKVEFLNGMPDPQPFTAFLFAGRRSPRPGLHLLQNLYLQQHLQRYGGTSSLVAWRVFRDYGWLEPDGSWSAAGSAQLKHPARPLRLVGTHAHEGSMGFAVLAAGHDERLGKPVSTLLWHLNYWLHTGDFTMLPDNFGSPVFAHMLSKLRLPKQFLRDYRALHPATDPDFLIRAESESMYSLLAGRFVRQDSGTMEGFGKVFPGFAKLASEIGSNADVEEARKLGYSGMGAGGYFGEKPWTKTGQLNGRLDLVAKICRVRVPVHELCAGSSIPRVLEGYPVKIGDFNDADPAKWYPADSEAPAKFACGPMVDERSRQRLFAQYRQMGAVTRPPFVNSEDKTDSTFDALDDGALQEAFDGVWAQLCFTAPE